MQLAYSETNLSVFFIDSGKNSGDLLFEPDQPEMIAGKEIREISLLHQWLKQTHSISFCIDKRYIFTYTGYQCWLT